MKKSQWIYIVIMLMFISYQISYVKHYMKKETGRKIEKTETCQATSLPKIDREAALELLDSGECIGGEIEEAKFTVWVCKE